MSGAASIVFAALCVGVAVASIVVGGPQDVLGAVSRASTPLRHRPAPASSISEYIDIDALWHQVRTAAVTGLSQDSPPAPNW